MSHLVLSRKVGERIVTDGPCTIEVTRITGTRTTLSFVAEPETRIVREELIEPKEMEAAK